MWAARICLAIIKEGEKTREEWKGKIGLGSILLIETPGDDSLLEIFFSFLFLFDQSDRNGRDILASGFFSSAVREGRKRGAA